MRLLSGGFCFSLGYSPPNLERGFALKLCIRVWPLASVYLTVKVVPYEVK